MRISVTAADDEGVWIDVDPTYAVARHLGGVLIWRMSPGFETYEELDPSSSSGPLARGGMVFIRVVEVDPTEPLEAALLCSVPVRLHAPEVERGTWAATEIPMAGVEWTDGVASTLTLLLRPAPDVGLEIEYSIQELPGERWVEVKRYDEPGSLLRAITGIGGEARSARSP